MEGSGVKGSLFELFNPRLFSRPEDFQRKS
jgi:hypothetical protein